ncbi:MAG: carbohydrate ABC transporter permease [Anaerolineae bacterium]
MSTLTQTSVSAPTREKRKRQSWVARLWPERWYVHLALIFSIVILGFPVYYAIVVSTQTNAQVFAYQMIPGDAFEANLRQVMNQNIWQYMANSTLVALGVAGAKTLLSLLAGLAIVYFRFPAKTLIFGFILITLMMPQDVLIIGLFRFVAGDLGWGDTYHALVIPLAASATGVFLFRQHFTSISPELSEAAQLDGANPIQFLFRVLVPMSWNTISALAIIMFLAGWNQYLWPRMIISTEANQVIQVGLRRLLSGAETGETFGPLMLGAVIASIPPILVFILMQKQFMSGFSLTRDK